MSVSFYDQPIPNSPYAVPGRHHALDRGGQPLDLPPYDGRRPSKLITPVSKMKRKNKVPGQSSFISARRSQDALQRP